MTTVRAQDVRIGYLEAMRRLAATVTLITAGRRPEWSGMAATAVLSLSVEPPTLLIAVNRNASIYPVISSQRRFRVNILAEEHRDLIPDFSGVLSGADRFAPGDWEEDEFGQAVLMDATASIGCDVETVLDHVSHTIFTGRVFDVRYHSNIAPLVWLNGAASTLSGELH